MADKEQQFNYLKNTEGGGTSKAKPATVMPAKKKHVSTRMGEVIADSVSNAVKNAKNKKKINS